MAYTNLILFNCSKINEFKDIDASITNHEPNGVYSNANLNTLNHAKLFAQKKGLPVVISEELNEKIDSSFSSENGKEAFYDFQNRLLGKIKSISIKNTGKSTCIFINDYSHQILLSFFSGVAYNDFKFSNSYNEKISVVQIKDNSFKVINLN